MASVAVIGCALAGVSNGSSKVAQQALNRVARYFAQFLIYLGVARAFPARVHSHIAVLTGSFSLAVYFQHSPARRTGMPPDDRGRSPQQKTSSTSTIYHHFAHSIARPSIRTAPPRKACTAQERWRCTFANLRSL